MKHLSKQVTFLGYYQIIGGVVGMLVSAILLKNVWHSPFMSMFLPVILFSIGLYAFSIFAGRSCLSQQRHHLLLSKINQMIQTIGLQIWGWTFTFTAGVHLSLGFKIEHDFFLMFDFGMSSFNFGQASTSNTSFFMINLVALFLVFKITQLENKQEEIAMHTSSRADDPTLLDTL